MKTNIIKCIQDKNLFRSFLANKDGDLSSWQNWITAIKVLYGLPIRSKRERLLISECTGRRSDLLPKQGFDVAAFIVGRRSGKSVIVSVAAGFEAVLSGKEKLLQRGEIPLLPVISPTKQQSRIVTSYLRAIFQTPMLEAEVVSEDKEGFLLRNGVRIQILSGDYRTVRGYTLIGCVCDEIAYFGLSEEGKIRSDSELVRSLLPGLSTVNGRLLCIGSPYARKGWSYSVYKKNFANDRGSVLVWNCPSRTMNPKLPQSVVDAAIAEDLESAKSEFLGQFRDDICAFLPRDIIEGVVRKGRQELLPRSSVSYTGFCDISGGRSDSGCLAIAHKQDGKAVLDLLKEYRAPYNPSVAIENMSGILKRYGIVRCLGDSYSGEFCTAAFRRHGISYQKANKNKSQIYLEMLPLICSGAVELLDSERLIVQFSNLQRRVRSGGSDAIDHMSGTHDDMCNGASGACVFCSRPTPFLGVICRY